MAHGAGEPGLRSPVTGLTTITHTPTGFHLRQEHVLIVLLEDLRYNTFEA